MQRKAAALPETRAFVRQQAMPAVSMSGQPSTVVGRTAAFSNDERAIANDYDLARDASTTRRRGGVPGTPGRATLMRRT